MSTPTLTCLAAAQRSRFAAQRLLARPALAEILTQADQHPYTRDRMQAALADLHLGDEALCKQRLRQLREAVVLSTLARDLSGRADLDEVCSTMSDLAEVCVIAATRWAEAQAITLYGTPRDAQGRAQTLLVVGMGKLGGRELNVSSDIDLIFLYPEQGETDGTRRLENADFFARVGRKIIALLNERTEDGFVFRVDMRLRPNGDAGPLALSLDALENYFVAHGREWERYAWIKARPLTGQSNTDWPALEAIRRPFVFRKYLDYATLEAMRQLHAEVRREVARRDLVDHIKLGPGGIREIEFIAQALQLIRGGRDAALMAQPTREVLRALGQRGLLPLTTVDALIHAYHVLRNLEHRLQYADDAQTHTLPSNPIDQALIAQWCGYVDWAHASASITEVRHAVAMHFEAVFAQTSPAEKGFAAVWQDPLEDCITELRRQGFRAPEESAQRLLAVRTSQRYSTLPTDSRTRFDALVPRLAQAAAQTAEPDVTLTRGLDLMQSIARRAAYLALLAEQSQALERLARMIGASAWAAEFITRHPLLLDELFDDRVLYSPPDWGAFRDALSARLAQHPKDTEQQMHVLRESHHAQVFRLLAQDLAGLLSVEQLADHLSMAADLVLEAALNACWSALNHRHREDAPRFAIIGYGKLGGKELGYASDLDIIFLFDDPHPKASEVYARLAQRLNTWLTARTASGQLFETDLRLRPSGASGLLVSSVDAFTHYQVQDAWVWEHQALTRARFCAGDRTVGIAFERIRLDVLQRQREPKALAQAVLEMRQRMREAHPNPSDAFDLKHDRNGMVDIEFAVQFLVLAHAAAHPSLCENLGNIALLARAASLGLIPVAIAAAAQDAYRTYRRRQHQLRMNGERYARVPPEQVSDHRAAAHALWQYVFETT